MLLGLSVMITVFSSFENPAFTMRFVILGQAMGAAVALGASGLPGRLPTASCRWC
jgi:hypothetical protein